MSGTIYKFIEKSTARLADKIITVSEFDRQLALVGKVASNECMRVVHNGMPEDSFVFSDPEIQPPRLVMTARLDDQKDHSTLLLALSHLKDLPWSLDLIGDGPLQSSLVEQAIQLKISDRVQFLGLRNDVPALLGRAQIFLLISHWEGFPRSILEAMRAGLPVIATDVAGVPESVINGVTGLLIPRSDVRALVTSIRCLLVDPSKRVALGAAGQARFKSEFTFEQMFLKTLLVYDEIMLKHGLDHRYSPLVNQSSANG